MSNEQIRIEIGGQDFENFKTASVTRRLDTVCGEFSFTASTDFKFNINNNSVCKIFVNEKLVLTGYIETLNPSIEPTSHDIEITGRDLLSDLVDSSIPSNLNIQGGITLAEIATKIINGLGIPVKVINNVTNLAPFSKTELISAEPDQNAFDLINQYASKRSVLITSDANSNLIITRASDTRVADKLVNYKSDTMLENNIKSSNASYDNSQRFNKYTVISQENSSANGASFNINTVNIKGIATDNEIRSTRQIIIQAENASSSDICTEIAGFEANIRRANALNYTCQVQGFSRNNGDIWWINELVEVIDEDELISSELLTKAVTFNIDAGSGSNTNLEFGLRDAYTLQANLDELQQRVNKTGNETQALSPEQVERLLAGENA